MSKEVRYTDPKTGGQKGVKEERYDLIPVWALAEVARVYGYGASKYDDRNWEKGYPWGLSIAALERHLAAFKAGESLDSESGKHHLACVIFHAMALMTFDRLGLGEDNRSLLGTEDPRQPSPPSPITERHATNVEDAGESPAEGTKSYWCPTCCKMKPRVHFRD